MQMPPGLAESDHESVPMEVVHLDGDDGKWRPVEEFVRLPLPPLFCA